MNKERKKELVRKYLETKTPMGILGIRNIKGNKVYLEIALDTKSKINRLAFQLGAESCPIKTLQQDWKRLGEEAFVFEVLEHLDYDRDESKTDYSEELKILKYMCEERLQNNGVEFYK